MKNPIQTNLESNCDEKPKSRGTTILVFSLTLLIIALAIFFILPPTVPVDTLKVPIISGLVGFSLAALGNIAIAALQHRTSVEAARVLSSPLIRLDNAVGKLEEIHFYHEQGIEGIYSNRNAAMHQFLEEIEREDRWIGIVGTSLLGVIDPSNRNEEKHKLTEILLRKRRDKVKIDALLMHPAYGEFRERVENRSPAAVAKDIQATLTTLIEQDNAKVGNQLEFEKKKPIFGVDNVKLYPGVITAFAIFTKRAMLLNTSSLTGPVYDNVTLIIRDTTDPNSLYKKFRASHFDEPWKSEKTITLTRQLLDILLTINFADEKYRFKEGAWPTTIIDERNNVDGRKRVRRKVSQEEAN